MLHNENSFLTSSPEETEKLAKELIEQILYSKIVLLSGPLGSGKTTFVKGLAKALGIEKAVKSPTYTYVNAYLFSLPNDQATMNNDQKMGRLSEPVDGISGPFIKKPKYDVKKRFLRHSPPAHLPRNDNAKLAPGPRSLLHYDLYRLPEHSENPERIKAEIGLENALKDPHSLIVIEWPERLGIEDGMQIQFEKKGEKHLISILGT